MCESIAHQPLRGSCPAPSLNLNHNLLGQGTGTADHLTLLQLFQLFIASTSSLNNSQHLYIASFPFHLLKFFVCVSKIMRWLKEFTSTNDWVKSHQKFIRAMTQKFEKEMITNGYFLLTIFISQLLIMHESIKFLVK